MKFAYLICFSLFAYISVSTKDYKPGLGAKAQI